MDGDADDGLPPSGLMQCLIAAAIVICTLVVLSLAELLVLEAM